LGGHWSWTPFSGRAMQIRCSCCHWPEMYSAKWEGCRAGPNSSLLSGWASYDDKHNSDYCRAEHTFVCGACYTASDDATRYTESGKECTNCFEQMKDGARTHRDQVKRVCKEWVHDGALRNIPMLSTLVLEYWVDLRAYTRFGLSRLWTFLLSFSTLVRCPGLVSHGEMAWFKSERKRRRSTTMMPTTSSPLATTFDTWCEWRHQREPPHTL